MLKDFEKGNKMNYVWGGRRQRFSWVNEISYLYDNMKKEQKVHVVVCEEMWDEVAPDGSICNARQSDPRLSGIKIPWILGQNNVEATM